MLLVLLDEAADAHLCPRRESVSQWVSEWVSERPKQQQQL